MDNLTPEVRSRTMASVKSKNTKPEKAVRSELHNLGLRFSLHDRNLPGAPDIVFRKAKVAVQVRGCFWHSHKCKRTKPPASSKKYWLPKLEATKKRDDRNDRLLRKYGWKVLVVWECKIGTQSELHHEVRRIAAAIRRRSGNNKETKLT